ncbi:hypothetical protein LTR84_003342 [Exophiala bonariae]|uniref:F-box domain-containing protein n=1 Tax=Exophiala bonariae TaxID=1690606 RepID=A0AAV9N6T7_9EURO|nr:hypothetical protein LTR84_003342 [Exophiala bonariae]
MSRMLAGGGGTTGFNNDIFSMRETFQRVAVDPDVSIGGLWTHDVFDTQFTSSTETKRKVSGLGESKYKSGIKSSRTDPYNPFFIPHSVLFNPNDNSQNNRATVKVITGSETKVTPLQSQWEETPILTLPVELLTKIFQQVKVPYFQVCLALTCKTMGQVASKPGVMSPWRGYRDKDGLFRLLERKAWIPRTLRLCRACFVHVPCDQKYWEAKIAQSIEFDRRDLNWLDIFNFLDRCNTSGHRCPWCAVRRYISFPSETAYKDEIRKAADDIQEWGTVCPNVCRRIDQP